MLIVAKLITNDSGVRGATWVRERRRRGLGRVWGGGDLAGPGSPAAWCFMVTRVTSDALAGAAAGPGPLAGAPRGSSPPGLPDPGRCLVMGVVNVTPDSFSDGGEWFGTDVAIARGRQLAAQGADIVDAGGESTRPGAQRISAAEELHRVVPVIAGLAR